MIQVRRMPWLGWVALALLVWAAPARADLINLTGAEKASTVAEIHVRDDKVRLVLEIGPSSLKAFANLQPKPAETQAERFRAFFTQDLRLIADGGKPLIGQVRVIEVRPRIQRNTLFGNALAIRGSRLVRLQASKQVVYVEIDYPLKKRPKTLTIKPPTGAAGEVVATIGFILYHRSVPVLDFRYLPGAATATLDWTDPWYSRFAHPNLRRHHKSGVFAYLYVEPFEVRHEVLVRLRDLENWLDLGLEGKSYVTVAEQADLKSRIGDFFAKRSRVLINGKSGKPVVDRIQFMAIGQAGPQFDAKQTRREIATTFVGVILSYNVQGLPQSVAVDWDMFADRIKFIPATVTDPAGPIRQRLEPSAPRLVWKNVLTNYQQPTVTAIAVTGGARQIALPWASILFAAIALWSAVVAVRRYRRGRTMRVPLIGVAVGIVLAVLVLRVATIDVRNPLASSASLPEKTAKPLLTALLKNVYRAFEFRGERAVYDKLSLTVSGNLLTEIYLQNRKATELKNQGGARARVKSVKVLAVQAVSSPEGDVGQRFRAQWVASGSVGHWGHIHQRRNRYAALVTIRPLDGAWKIVDLQFLEQRRIDGASAAPRPNAKK